MRTLTSTCSNSRGRLLVRLQCVGAVNEVSACLLKPLCGEGRVSVPALPGRTPERVWHGDLSGNGGDIDRAGRLRYLIHVFCSSLGAVLLFYMLVFLVCLSPHHSTRDRAVVLHTHPRLHACASVPTRGAPERELAETCCGGIARENKRDGRREFSYDGSHDGFLG